MEGLVGRQIDQKVIEGLVMDRWNQTALTEVKSVEGLDHLLFMTARMNPRMEEEVPLIAHLSHLRRMIRMTRKRKRLLNQR